MKIKKEVKRAIDDFCDKVSNSIALKDIVPISLTQYNDSDVIHTLLHYINLFSVTTKSWYPTMWIFSPSSGTKLTPLGV